MPADLLRLGDYYWRLAKDRGDVQYEASPAQFYAPQVAQADVTEANAPPEVRIPISFRDLSGGGGQSEVPQNETNRRYDRVGDAEGEGVDATLTPAGPLIPAAALTTVTPPTQTPTDNLFGVLWKGGAETAYFAMGRFVYSWDGTTFTQVGDLGVGLGATDKLIPFRGTATAEHWYAPLGYAATPKFSTDLGVTWTAVTTSGGLDLAQSMVVVDGEVVVARATRTLQGNAMLCSFDDGGAAPTIFGVIDPVGDPAFPISKLLVFDDRVVVLKDGEGVFLLTNDRRSLEQDVFPELRGATLYVHGATVWRGLLWLPTNRGLYAIGPGFTLQAVGPEQSETTFMRGGRGVVTSVAGDAHHLYGFRYPGSGLTSWLYKAVVSTGGGGVQDIAWHPFVQLITGAQSAHMAAISPGGNGPKLLIDRETQAGAFTLYHLRTPARGRDPRADPDYRYCAGGTLYHSRLQGRFPAVNKGWYGLTPFTSPLNIEQDGETATTALTVRTRYKLGTVALTGASPFGYTQGAAQTAGEGMRDPFFLRGRALDTGVRLATSDPEVCAQVRAVTVDYDLEPDALWQHRATLDISEGSAVAGGASGGADPLSPAAALAYLRTLPATGQHLLIDPWENSYDVTVPLSGVRVRGKGDGQHGYGGDLALLVDVLANEQQARAQGTYDNLLTFTYDQLKATFATYDILAAAS